jgi:hypothetical protein
MPNWPIRERIDDICTVKGRGSGAGEARERRERERFVVERRDQFYSAFVELVFTE